MSSRIISQRKEIDIARATALYESGMTLRQVAQQLDVNRETLKTTLLAAGIEIRRAEAGRKIDGFKIRRAAQLRGQGKPFHMIAAEVGVSVMTARAYCLRAKAGLPQKRDGQTLDAGAVSAAASAPQRQETEVTKVTSMKSTPIVKFEPAKIEERIASLMREPVRLQPAVEAVEKRYRALLQHRQAIIDAHRAGYGIRRIARTIGATYDDVKRVLVEAGETPHNEGPLATDGQKGLQAIEADRAARLYADGATLAQVAADLGVNVHAARALIVSRGVRIRPPGVNRQAT